MIAVGGVCSNNDSSSATNPSLLSSQSGRLNVPLEMPAVLISFKNASADPPGFGKRCCFCTIIVIRWWPSAIRWRVAVMQTGGLSGPALAIGIPFRRPNRANEGQKD